MLVEITKITELNRIESQKLPIVPSELDNFYPVYLTLNFYLCKPYLTLNFYLCKPIFKNTSKNILFRPNLQRGLVAMLISKAAIMEKVTTTLRRVLLLYSFFILVLIKVTHYWVFMKRLS